MITSWNGGRSISDGVRRTGAFLTMRLAMKRLVCVLLPNKQRLDCDVTVQARGREVMASILQHLDISELHVFGLAVLRDNEYLFVDSERKLKNYFGERWNRSSLKVPFILFLRVQYYVLSGQQILSSQVQQLYFEELRQKVLQSQSRQQEGLFFGLAASALQAEVGDLEERREKKKHYFLPEDYFPSWLMKGRGRDFLLQHAPMLHAEMRGLSRSRAVRRFISDAISLQDVSLTFYRMRREKKEWKSSILLGVALDGVRVFQEVEGKQRLLYDFSWTDVDRLTFQGRRFEVSVVGSLCLPKLVYYTPSAFHSKHILTHIRDSHQVHITTRTSASYHHQIEDMDAQFFRETYICDTTRLQHRLQSITSSMSDCSIAAETTAAWCAGEEEEEQKDVNTELELCVDETEEVLVDDPAEVSWLAELLCGTDGPLALPSSLWAAVTVEMKQVLMSRGDGGLSVD